MKVLRFTQLLLKISVVLPAFDENTISAIVEFLKKVAFILPGTYAVITSFSFIFVHIDNLSLVASSMWISLGCLNTVCLNIALTFEMKRVHSLLKNIETLVNESQYIRHISDRK